MIVIFASGAGTNFEAICRSFKQRYSIVLICNEPNALVLKKAEKLHIPFYLIPHSDFRTRVEHENAIFEVLQNHVPNTIFTFVLAGYMRILSASFISKLNCAWPNAPIINLHPALLDQYKGAKGYMAAVNSKLPFWGITVHHVSSELDSGQEIKSCTVPLFPYETEQMLQLRVQPLEHNLLICSLNSILQNLPKTSSTLTHFISTEFNP